MALSWRSLGVWVYWWTLAGLRGRLRCPPAPRTPRDPRPPDPPPGTPPEGWITAVGAATGGVGLLKAVALAPRGLD